MNKHLSYIFMFCLFFLSSCKLPLSTDTSNQTPLSLTLAFKQKSFDSFENVTALITLTNIGDENILVNGKMLFLPIDTPAKALQGLILISDNSGKPIYLNGFINYEFPNKDQLVVLAPGQSLEKTFTLYSVGFSPQYFKGNETYTVTVAYQNSFEVTKVIDTKEIKSWVGKIQSNSDTFEIVP